MRNQRRFLFEMRCPATQMLDVLARACRVMLFGHLPNVDYSIDFTTVFMDTVLKLFLANQHAVERYNAFLAKGDDGAKVPWASS